MNMPISLCFFFNSCYQGQLNPCKGRVDGKELSLVLKKKRQNQIKAKPGMKHVFDLHQDTQVISAISITGNSKQTQVYHL